MSNEITAAFQRTLEEGERRLCRSWAVLLATGAVGGFDVGVGVLGLLLVLEATGNELVAALAFGIGFIALALARSELFTENFLVPVAAVVAKRAPMRALGRLWAGTALTNLMAGWVFTGLIVAGFPRIREAAIEVGGHYAEMGIGWESFAAGIVGGMAITLMTWMQTGTDSVTGKLVAAYVVAFLLAAAAMNHAIVLSLTMFAALHAGAPFGYLDWLGASGWAALANMVGGLGLVTVLRLIQVGRAEVAAQRQRGAGRAREESAPEARRLEVRR